jgi:D-glycero-D-manno-heptose 1,7-bisphosphate phosphatase
MAAINAVHAHMMQRLQQAGGRLDAVFFCPHTPEDECDCRKPRPGLLLQIGRRYGIELSTVPMVCDTLRDLQAAMAAGCEPHLVRSGRAETLSVDELRQIVEQVPSTEVHSDLAAFAEYLLERDHVPSSGPGGLH